MVASTSAYTKPPPLTNVLSLLVIMCCATNLVAHAAAAGHHRGGDDGGSGGDTAAMRERYERWVAQHGRTYRDHAEKARRYEVFKSNAEFIDSYNAANGGGKSSSPRLATNKFSDLTDDEFHAMFLSDGG